MPGWQRQRLDECITTFRRLWHSHFPDQYHTQFLSGTFTTHDIELTGPELHAIAQKIFNTRKEQECQMKPKTRSSDASEAF